MSVGLVGVWLTGGCGAGVVGGSEGCVVKAFDVALSEEVTSVSDGLSKGFLAELGVGVHD